MSKPSQENLQARVEELESLLNLMTEYAALHAGGADFQGTFVEKMTFGSIANDENSLICIVEHCRQVLKGGA